MKYKALSLVFCVSCLLMFAAVLPSPQQRVLLIDYPTNQVTTNVVINFERTPVITSNFVWFTNMPLDLAHRTGVTNGTGTYALTFTVVPGAMFYRAKASNTWWGIESSSSNTNATDPIPVEPGIGIR